MLRTSTHFSIPQWPDGTLPHGKCPDIILRMLGRHIRAAGALAIFAAGFGAIAAMRPQVKPFAVYHDGDDLIFTPEAAGTRKLASVGPWNLGERLGDEKPAAKHQTFRPATLIDFKDIPSHALMAERLSIKSMADLKPYRRRDGSLPQLLILPAHLAVRATAEIRDVTITTPAH